jgi:exodeoxyribonuclease VII large subunit
MRLPFDPDKIAAPQRPSRADKPMTVSEVSRLVKDVVARGIPGKVRIVGEVSNFTDRNHWFFSLKDDAAALRCVCFASAARRIGFDVRDGLEVIATGRVDYFEGQGQLQLYVDKLEPVGEGALERKLRALMDELRQAGYFAPEHKQPLPVMAQRIAVVTSRTAAALQDVIDTTRRRWPGCRLFLYDVRVQGDAAAGEIADALRRLSKHGRERGIDAIILTRGGGSIEDLWAFNERIVADAVYNCKLPVVAAIGHETDTTIAELVADARCATPTQAAMTLVPERDALQLQVDQMDARLSLLLRRLVEYSAQRLGSAMRHRLFTRPDRMLDPVAERLANFTARLQRGVETRARAEQQKLTSLGRQLETVGPRNVLERGYSYTLDRHGKVLRHAAQAKAGDRITTVLADGKIASTVDGGPAAKPRKCPPKTQMDLFNEPV